MNAFANHKMKHTNSIVIRCSLHISNHAEASFLLSKNWTVTHHQEGWNREERLEWNHHSYNVIHSFSLVINDSCESFCEHSWIAMMFHKCNEMTSLIKWLSCPSSIVMAIVPSVEQSGNSSPSPTASAVTQVGRDTTIDESASSVFTLESDTYPTSTTGTPWSFLHIGGPLLLTHGILRPDSCFPCK